MAVCHGLRLPASSLSATITDALMAWAALAAGGGALLPLVLSRGVPAAGGGLGAPAVLRAPPREHKPELTGSARGAPGAEGAPWRPRRRAGPSAAAAGLFGAISGTTPSKKNRQKVYISKKMGLGAMYTTTVAVSR